MEKYVLVVGSANSGKTSLIESITQPDKKPSKSLVSFSKPRSFSLNSSGIEYKVHFVDTTQTHENIQEHRQLFIADLIVLVVDSEEVDAAQSVVDQWVPAIQQVRKPLFIVQSKIDKNQDYEEIDLHNVYERFVGSIGYSVLQEETRETLVYELFNYLFFNPTSILYDYDKRELRELAVDALKRVFWLLDEDHDKQLNEEEYAQFKTLSGIDQNLTAILKLVGSSVLDFDAFLRIQQHLINNRNITAVWNVLRAFDFNTGLIVEDRAIIDTAIPHTTPQDLITLTDYAYKELAKLFNTFDSNNDGLLSEEELAEAFSICFDFENPFARINPDYLSITATENGKMTIDGWLSLWSLATLQNPYSLIKCLIRWGIKQRLDKYLTVKKLRKHREFAEEYPKIVNAYIFGAVKTGKTALMQNLVGRTASAKKYEKTTTRNSVVNVVETEDGDRYYLAITEFEDTQILSVLESEHIMEKCDIAIMAYDGSDPHSFSYLAKVQQKLDPNIPCAYIITKYDLDLADQVHEVSPDVFCEELSLPWPPICHSSVEYDSENNKTFEDILYFALHPSDARPIWDAPADEEGDDSDSEFEQNIRKPSLFIRTLKIVGVAGALSLGVALLWKFVVKSNDRPSDQQCNNTGNSINNKSK